MYVPNVSKKIEIKKLILRINVKNRILAHFVLV